MNQSEHRRWRDAWIRRLLLIHLGLLAAAGTGLLIWSLT